MAAYLIALIEVADPAAYDRYRQLVAPTLVPYGGRFLVRGGRIEAAEGDPPQRAVVLEFDSMETARRWYDSPEYAGPKAIRRGASTSRAFFVEGVPPG